MAAKRTTGFWIALAGVCLGVGLCLVSAFSTGHVSVIMLFAGMALMLAFAAPLAATISGVGPWAWRSPAAPLARRDIIATLLLSIVWLGIITAHSFSDWKHRPLWLAGGFLLWGIAFAVNAFRLVRMTLAEWSARRSAAD
jgi:hypothetical protein